MLELPSGDVKEYLDRTIMEINRIILDIQNKLDTNTDTVNAKIAELETGMSELEARVEALENE